MRIWIRADGNEQIASGHLRRCLTIAESLAGLGASPAFLLADQESGKMYRKAAGKEETFPYYVLDIPYGNPMAEIPALEDLCRRPVRKISETGVHYGRPVEEIPVVGKREETPAVQHPDWILVDSYVVTQGYFDALYGAFPDVKIAYIDDLMRLDPDVNLVINYDPDVNELQKFYHKAETRLLGPSYVPLRKQFREAGGQGEYVSGIPAQRRNTSQKDVLRILISTGGTDPYNMAGSLEETVHLWAEEHRKTRKCGMQEQVAVVAPGYPYVSDMAGLMRSCDLAVSAAGTTLYELCAVGVPSISFSMTDNQELFAGKMDAAGLIPYAGDVRAGEARGLVLQRVKSWLREQIRLPGMRKKQSFRMRAAVDGHGADRIAQTMINEI